MAQKQNYSKTNFSGQKLQVLWSEKKPTTLPPILQAKGHIKGKTKSLIRMQPVPLSQSSVEMTNQSKNLRGMRKRDQMHHGKMQAKIRLMRSMLRNQRASLQELYSHEGFLSRLNQELVQSIQDMEDNMAVNVRTMLHQQGVLGNVIHVLEYSNKNRVEQLKAELQKWEEKEENKIKKLQKQVDRLNAEIRKAQEEVSFLSTYMDHEYPVRSVQITNHIRRVQQARNRQQDELDNLREMRETVLRGLGNMIQAKKESILKTLMAKIQKPYEEVLLLKTLDSHHLRRSIVWFREFIKKLREEVPRLMAEVEQIYSEVWNPREAVFKDVLLQRPKCTPDMAVELNIPIQEPFPF